MIRIYMAGQKVPEWLEKVEVEGEVDTVSLRFSAPSLVYQQKGGFVVKPLICSAGVMRLTGAAKTINIIGQSPAGSATPVSILNPAMTTIQALCLLCFLVSCAIA